MIASGGSPPQQGVQPGGGPALQHERQQPAPGPDGAGETSQGQAHQGVGGGEGGPNISGKSRDEKER